MPSQCPVCHSEPRKVEDRDELKYIECLRCGPFTLQQDSLLNLVRHVSNDLQASAKLSHALYKMTERDPWPLLSDSVMESILSNTELPTPQQQLDNFIMWLGNSQPSIGEDVQITDRTIAAVGALNEDSLGFLCVHAVERRLVASITSKAMSCYMFGPAQLTLDGWEYFYELQRGVPGKYPPAEPGALICEPLKAAVRGR